ncbi:MAG: M28 family peptidase [Xanthomonadales bacterium]|nr:M28 family peptidase [Xanthomonadales bacterium]
MTGRALGWLLLVVTIVVGTQYLVLPAPLPADTAADRFSAERAMRHVREIAQVPHVIGSPANERVRDYLVEELNDLGFDVVLQTERVVYDHPRRKETAVRVAWPTNVLARLPGTGSGPAVALMSHYDTAASAPGAADAGSGVATLLETARAIVADPTLNRHRDLLLIITDGEEIGLMGAQAFLRKHPWAQEVGLILNFEARGAAGPAFMFETGRGNSALVDAFAQTAPLPLGSSLSVDIYRRMPNDTDATIVAEAGIPFLNFAFVDDFFRYHAGTDTPENLSRRSLQHEGSNALALTRQFLRVPELPDRSDDATFFNVTGGWLVRYGQSVVWITGLAAVLIAGLALGGAWVANRLTVGGIGLAILGLTATAGGVFWLVTGLHLLLTTARPGYAFFYHYHLLLAAYCLLALGIAGGLWHARPVIRRGFAYAGAALVLAVAFFFDAVGWAAVGAAVIMVCYGHFGSRVSAPHLAASAYSLWVVGLIALLLKVPHASYLVAWPVIIGGLLWILVRHREIRPVIALVPWIFLWAPMIYLFYLALGVFQPGAVMVLLVLLLAVGATWFANARTEAPVFVTAGLALVVVAALNTDPTADRPHETELFYAVDATNGENWWATRGDEWPAWASARLGSSDRHIEGERWFPASDALWPAVAADPVPVVEPWLETDTTETTGGFRIGMVLGVPDGPERIDLYLPAADYQVATLDNQAVPLPVEGELWRWRLYAPPKQPVHIVIQGRGRAPEFVKLTAVQYNSPESVTAMAPATPEDLMGAVWGFHGATLLTRRYDLNP